MRVILTGGIRGIQDVNVHAHVDVALADALTNPVNDARGPNPIHVAAGYNLVSASLVVIVVCLRGG